MKIEKISFKKQALLVVLVALVIYSPLIVSLTGCKAAGANPATLAPGAKDATDDGANKILQPAHAFALSVTNAVLSTDPNIHIELTAAQKNVLITLNKGLNVADSLEIAYHATPNPANASALTSAANTVQQDLSSAQSIITLPTAAQ